MGTEDLVETEHVVVGATGLHVHQTVRRVRHRVHHQLRTAGMHALGDLRDRVDAAQNVRRVGHRHVTGARSQQGLKVVQLQLQTGRIHRPHAQRGPALFAQALPRADVGFVIGVGDDDLVARPDRGCNRPCQQLQEQRGRAGHHALFGVTSIDQLGHRGTGFEHLLTGLHRRRVRGAQLHGMVEQIVAHTLGHWLEHCRTAGIVQVAVTVGECRELATNVVDIEGSQSESPGCLSGVKPVSDAGWPAGTPGFAVPAAR